MELTQQEQMFLDRMALHMIASGSLDIDAAARAIIDRDAELLNQIGRLTDRRETIALEDGWECSGDNAIEPVIDAMARRVHAQLQPAAPRRQLDKLSPRVAKLQGGVGPDRSILYLVDSSTEVYVTLDELRLHMDGKCKPSTCPRCALGNH